MRRCRKALNPCFSAPAPSACRVGGRRRGYRFQVGHPRVLSGGASVPATMPGFQPPLIKPCVRFSLTRLSCEKSGTRWQPPRPVVSVQTQFLIQVSAVIPLPAHPVPVSPSLEYSAQLCLHVPSNIIEDRSGVPNSKVVDPSAHYLVRPFDLLSGCHRDAGIEHLLHPIPQPLLRLLRRIEKRHPLRP